MLLTLMQNWPGICVTKTGEVSAISCSIHVWVFAWLYRKCRRIVCNHIVPQCKWFHWFIAVCVCLCIHLKFYLCTLCVLHTFQFIPLPIDTYRVRLFNDVKNAQLLWTRERIWETVSQPDGTWRDGEREQCRCGASSQWETEHLRPRLSAP